MDLLIKSFEGNIYLVEQCEGESSHVVRGSNNSPLRFDSIGQIKEHFQASDYENIWLEHQSVYDEMCGHKYSAESMRMPLPWK